MRVFHPKLMRLFLLVAGLCLVPSMLLAQDDAVLVTVTEVVAEDMSPVVPAAGTVFSRNATQITAGLAGRIEWIAEPGDFIEAGTAVALFFVKRTSPPKRNLHACRATAIWRPASCA